MKLEDIGFYTLNDERAKNASENSPLQRCELLITSKCNFKCPYCRGTSSDADITFEEAKEVIDLWANEGLKNIRFSGGEPTIVEWLPDIIEYAKFKNIERIAISTNGSKSLMYYLNLYGLGVNDFSISLDACCSSYADRMAGKEGFFDTISNNIKELSKLTYVTTGCVFNEDNVKQSLETITYADKLGVSDIRIITSAQYNKSLDFMKQIKKSILKNNKILNYRVENILKGRNVRGIQKKDYNKCPLLLDDMAIRGEYHYPCIIKMREGCKPIGKIGKEMRKERKEYFEKTNTHLDSTCRKNCLDVCIDYNNRWKEFNDKKD